MQQIVFWKSKRILSAWPAICLLILSANYLPAQTYNFTTYSLAEGLPQSQVFALCQDKQGYLWIGTQGGGLGRFDGLKFQTYTTADGLTSNYIYTLLEDPQGRLWIGTDQGLCRYDGRRFAAVRLGSIGAGVYALALAQKNNVWIGTNRGVFTCLLNESAARPMPLPGDNPKPSVSTIFPTEEGVWIGSDQGAWLIGRQNIRLGTKEGLASNAVLAIARDDENRLWISAVGGITIYAEENRLVVAKLRNPLLYRPYCLQADGENMWAGTANYGMIRFNRADSTLRQFTEKDGLPHQHVRSLLRDNTGQLWAGTSGGGLARLSHKPFRHFDQSRGLAGNRVYALHEDRQGRLWLGVSQNGVQIFDSTGFHPFSRDSGFLQIKCKTIAEDAEGNLWVGTEGRGIAVFDSAGMHRLNRQNGLPGDLVQTILRGAKGEMWVATLTGGIARVTRMPDGFFMVKTYGLREGMPNLQVQTLRMDREGNIWFATQSGRVGYIKNDRVEKVFGPKEGLPGVPVRVLAPDTLGRIWVGTKGAGLLYIDLRHNASSFQKLDPAFKLQSPNIYLLHYDTQGNLWIGSETGVDKLIFSSTGSAVDLQHFGKNKGFLGIETCHDAVLEDRKGRLWFGTMNGLTQYTPTNWEQTPVAPVLHLQTISLFYKPLSETAYAGWLRPNGSLADGLELPYHQNHLSFAFRAVDLGNPETIRYRWQLEGAETGWSPSSAQEQVNYANLSPGYYTFKVQATADGELFSEPVAVSFLIKKPLWQLWWFQLLLVLGLAALIALWIRAWLQRLKKTEQARRENLEVENRLLQLEQKALQLQMNPHFIFNALTSIQALITEQNYPTARQEINHFAKLMRSILANSRQQTISLQEEVNTLEQYLHIEQFCHQQKFDFEISLPEGADPEEIEIPPMLLQPFVENAVVHGVSPLPYPGKISIRFNLQGEILSCEICDNGIGRERAARLREEKKPGHQSAALQVTQERLEALRSGKPYKPLEISDILNQKGEIAGTRVIVRLPVTIQFEV